MARPTPWIKSHIEMGRHPKVRALADALGIPRAQAVGHLHMLWHETLEHEPYGDIGGWSVRQIAHAAGWSEYRAEFDWSIPDIPQPLNDNGFVQALIDSGWLDEDPLRPRNWMTYVGRLLKERERQRTLRGENKDSTRTDCVESAESTGEEVESEVELETDTEKKKTTTSAYPADFLAWYEHYPLKKGKAGALKVWKRLNGKRPSVEDLIRAVEDQKEWPDKYAGLGRNRPSLPAPSVWLNEGRWDDERPGQQGSTGKYTEMDNAEPDYISE